MSWQTYVDDHLVGTGKISQAAIIGQAGGSWATSSGLQVTPEQEQALITAFKSGPDALQASGIKVGDNKYMFLRPQGDSFYGKKGASGVCVTKSKQAIVIGEYIEGTTAVEANEIVEGIANYLVQQGF